MAKQAHTIVAASLGWDSAEVREHRYQDTRTPFPIFAIGNSYYAVRKDKPLWDGLLWEMALDQFWAKQDNTILWVAKAVEETPAPAAKTINLTPVGLSTPEGEKRVAVALKAFEESHATVANAASQFLSKHAECIQAAMVRSDDPDSVADYKELLELISDRSEAQDAFLRAVAGAPARAVTR